MTYRSPEAPAGYPVVALAATLGVGRRHPGGDVGLRWSRSRRPLPWQSGQGCVDDRALAEALAARFGQREPPCDARHHAEPAADRAGARHVPGRAPTPSQVGQVAAPGDAGRGRLEQAASVPSRTRSSPRPRCRRPACARPAASVGRAPEQAAEPTEQVAMLTPPVAPLNAAAGAQVPGTRCRSRRRYRSHPEPPEKRRTRTARVASSYSLRLARRTGRRRPRRPP